MMDLPFIPIRTALYTPAELLEGLDLNIPSSFETTKDCTIYRLFAMEDFGIRQSPFTSMMESLHDHFINQAVLDFLESKNLIVGIMGGHDIDRDTPAYRQVTQLARLLANRGALVVSGGGPGAMEAAHLGAAFCHGSNLDLDDAVRRLSAQPKLPMGLKNLVSPAGEFDRSLRDQYHAWWRPAIELYHSLGSNAGISLALPTWYFGRETFTPFASHIGKYFQNSLREDGLVTFCTGGVIYTPGKAGTVQEIFQDAAQNYYRSVNNRFSPMVFLGSEYWSSTLGAIPLLKQMFTEADFSSSVLVTDSIEQAADFLQKTTAPGS
jgi:predicted Rossmann-fold nucleotide-binding protein